VSFKTTNDEYRANAIANGISSALFGGLKENI
jgi:hypothetical protein